MSELNNLTDDDIIKINRIYNCKITDIFLQKKIIKYRKNPTLDFC